MATSFSRKVLCFFFFALCALLSGCASFSTFQTARVVPVNSYRVFMGADIFYSSETNSSIHEIKGNSIEYESLEIGGRIGAARYIDIGAKAAVPGTIAVDAKYQFVDMGALAASLGAGLSYLTLNANDNTSHVFDLMVPMYLSVDLADWFGIYSAGKLFVQSQIGSLVSNSTFAAGTMGIRIGNTGGVMLEGTYLTEINGNFNAVQGGIAIFFGSAPCSNFYVGRFGGEATPSGKAPTETAEPSVDAEVIKVSLRSRVITITHPHLKLWQQGDRVCVVSQGEELACGVVIKVNAAGAVAKMAKARHEVLPGMLVKRQSDNPVSRQSGGE